MDARKAMPVAVMVASEPKPRLLSEVIAALQRRDASMEDVPLLDAEFAEAVEERIGNRTISEFCLTNIAPQLA